MTKVKEEKEAASTTIKERACPEDKKHIQVERTPHAKKNLEHMQNKTKMEKSLAPAKGARGREARATMQSRRPGHETQAARQGKKTDG